ncbi:glycerol kinase GlpK [Xinfangfangia sp. D13-10-4-6]|uniref:glycerol kinase GlpK n=1 Tax=Pseudogemmobacter hezensis TaxID=2737662 RepID=UPI001551D7EE|nr:glycerol kinase GlpK [Pseudogemmobacter hezensis]NPD15945.1 glycerol kinase GlpK [Pseudogemmobacter hezensis]
MRYILAIDQGTTSSRAILFDESLTPVASAGQEITQHFPAPGQVEHDPGDLWSSVLTTCRAAIAKAGITPSQIAAIGITNQRETTLLWDRASGRPLHNAIVWQDRRTADICNDLREAGHEPMIQAKSGLLADPYFSGTKLKYLLDTIPGARARAERGELAFGTVDSWLIWNLTAGRVHATDATNASRSMLLNIRENRWDPGLCDLLGIPAALLPQVQDCAADYGVTDPDLFGAAIPILAVAGDQQAAMLGQACFQPGMMKATYGTGCFALLNTGERCVASENRLLTTIAWRLQGRTTYALEGSIFIAGAVVQWLRDGLQIIPDAASAEALALTADPAQEVVLVPAFTGLGAPYWRPDCRGAVFGLTRSSGQAEMARAALESVGYQTRDLITAMRRDMGGESGGSLRVDGGMSASDWTMQFLADMIEQRVERPPLTEATALGVAMLAALQAGIIADLDACAAARPAARCFTPQMSAPEREAKYARWSRAVTATLAY